MVIALGLLGSRPAAARRAKNPHLEAGIRLLDQAQDEKALLRFKKALRRRGNSRLLRVKIHMYLGITYLNLLREKRAERHFRRALKLDPELELPDGLSPKINEMVSRLRAEVQREKPVRRPPKRVRPARKPRPGPGPGLNISPVVQPPASDERSGGTYWPAFTALGVAVAAGGTGLALGIVARNKAKDANDLTLPSEVAHNKHEAAKQMALSANVLYGVAGAAAIASGILFYWGSRQNQGGRVSAVGVTPLDGGLLTSVGGVF